MRTGPYKIQSQLPVVSPACYKNSEKEINLHSPCRGEKKKENLLFYSAALCLFQIRKS